jgi:hypothetical protein
MAGDHVVAVGGLGEGVHHGRHNSVRVGVMARSRHRAYVVSDRARCRDVCAFSRSRSRASDGGRVFETYWTKRRGVEAMDYSYALMDLTLYGRQEPWEDSPSGWPQQCSNARTEGGSPGWPPASAWPGGRPIAQWPRLEDGHCDDLAGKATC